MAWSPDGARIVTESLDRTTRVWDTKSGQELKGEPIPQETQFGKLSPDGRLFAHCDGNRVVLVPVHQSFDEPEYRLFWTRPRLDRHLAEREIAEKAGDRFSEAFHLDRILAYSTDPQQHQWWLTYRHRRSLGKPTASARALAHSPEAFGPFTGAISYRQQIGRMKLLALQGDREALRCLGGLLIRLDRAAEAIAPLQVALATRPGGRPPVEGLLLAIAYAKQGNQAEARVWHQRAVDWLDLHQRPMQIASALGTTMTDGWAGMGELVRRQTDPRYNTFDWETWHECTVFRAEVEGLLAVGTRE